MNEAQKKSPAVREVSKVDLAHKTFDGEKADMYINTNQLGKTFMVTVHGADGRAKLIAVHL